MKNTNMPNDKIIDEMETLIKVASDSTRLRIMFCLLDKDENKVVEKCVGDIHEEVGISQSLCSHQLKILKNADLVGTRKEKTKIYYYLKDEHVRKLLEVVLEHVLEKM